MPFGESLYFHWKREKGEKCMSFPSTPSPHKPWTCHISLFPFWDDIFLVLLRQSSLFIIRCVIFVKSEPQTKLRTLLSVQNIPQKFPWRGVQYYSSTATVVLISDTVVLYRSTSKSRSYSSIENTEVEVIYNGW